MIRFTTESGSVYEIRNTPWDYQEVRRVNPAAPKRADGQWVRLIDVSPLAEGRAVILLTANPDERDERDEPNTATYRTTTIVTSIERSAA